MIGRMTTAQQKKPGASRAEDITAWNRGLSLGGPVVVDGEVGVVVCANFGTVVIRLPGERHMQLNMMQFAGALGLIEAVRGVDHGATGRVSRMPALVHPAGPAEPVACGVEALS